MRPLSLAALASALVLAAPAFAQDDSQAIPYDDGTTPSTPTPSTPSDSAQGTSSAGNGSLPYDSEATPSRPTEVPVEKQDRDLELAKDDDPSVGVGGQLVAGGLLLDASDGSGTQMKLAYGLRFTWDIGRRFSNDAIHNGLFADVTWLHAGEHGGTQEVFDDTGYNDFTIAPAWQFLFGEGSSYGFYVQAGVGMSIWSSTFQIDKNQTDVGGLKPLLQYGIGLRGRPLLSDEGRMRLTFRVELTRFRRAYFNDTFFGGSIGIAY